MATTMKLIAKTTLGASASNIEFTSIPDTYTDLFLVCNMRTDYSGVTDIMLRFNGAANDTGHSSRELRGDGSTTYSTSRSYIRIGWASSATETSNTFGSAEAYIPNYAGSTNKSISATGVQENNATTANIQAIAALWSSTAAITAIKIMAGAGSFVANSSAFLYGITKA